MLNVVVFGAGAIGGQTAAHLARAGTPVSLVDGWFHHVEAMRRSGLHVRRPDLDFTVMTGDRFKVLHIDELEQAGRIDVLVLALKSYDTQWALRYAAPYLAEEGFVVSAQNGINEEVIATIVGPERTLGCAVFMSGMLVAPREIVGTTRTDRISFVLGELDGHGSERASRMAELFAPVGPVEITNDIWGELWSKTTLNVMLNGFAAITGLSTWELWSDARALSFMVHLAGEAILAAEAEGHQVHDLRPPGSVRPMSSDTLKAAHAGDRDALDYVVRTFQETAKERVSKGEEGRASMLQDILRGRRTEIDYLNGLIVRKGQLHGIETIANHAIVDAVRLVEVGMRASDAASLEPLVASYPNQSALA